MTCWSTDEDLDTTLVLPVLQTDGWCVAGFHNAVSLDPRVRSRAKTVLSLAAIPSDLKPEEALPTDVRLTLG